MDPKLQQTDEEIIQELDFLLNLDVAREAEELSIDVESDAHSSEEEGL